MSIFNLLTFIALTLFFSCNTINDDDLLKKPSKPLNHLEALKNKIDTTGYSEWNLNEDAAELVEVNDSIAILIVPAEPVPTSSSARQYNAFTDNRYIQTFSNDESMDRYLLSGTTSLNNNTEFWDGTARKSFPQFSSQDYVDIEFNNGYVDDVETNHGPINPNDCGSFYEVLECTGQKFEDVKDSGRYAEEASCYISFYLCFPTRLLDCYLTGC